MSLTSAIVWKPPQELIETSNIKRFMNNNRITTYEDLVKRSTEDIEWFWDAVVKDLGIEWFRPYEKVLDISEGIPWAKWFLNGKINLVHNCVDRHATSIGRNKLALIWEGQDGSVTKLTYWELDREVSRLANALKASGFGIGDVAGIFMPMTPEAVIASLALSKIGAIYTPIFSGFGAEAVASRLSGCDAKLLFTVDGMYRRGSKVEMKSVADEAVRKCPSVGRMVVSRRIGEKVPWMEGRDFWWQDFLSSAPEECVTQQLDSEDPFLIIYTSGTTGRPKGSVHVHGGFLVKIAQEVAYQVDLKDHDILFWLTDMGWIMAPWEIVGGLALGGTIFLYEGAIDYPRPDRIWDMVERHGITILGVSPTAIRALMRHGDDWVRKHDMSTLRILGSTGEPWNPDAWLWFFDKVGGQRCPIINFSGGTEVGACFLSPLPIMPLKPSTLGGPSLGMDVDVFNDEGKPVRNEVGELVAKKPWPSMTRGIWKDPQRYLETYWSRWKDVWVHGDWASIDEDGFWYLHGRSDDTIKLAGKRVGPAEIESALTSHPAVTEAAAIGVPDEVKGEVVVCFSVLNPSYRPSESLREALSELVASRLGKAFKPREVKFVAHLPKTRNAKIVRRLIRAKYLGQRDLGDLSNLENPEAIEEIALAK